MTATEADTRAYRLGEFHRFEAAGAHFLYLVPAGAIFAVDTAVGKLIDCLSPGELPHEQISRRSGGKRPHDRRRRGIDRGDVSLQRDRRPRFRSGRAAAASRCFSHPDAGDEPHQPVQSVVPILLRVRRRQTGHARRQAEVHGCGNGQDFGGFLARAIGRPAVDSHHFLRRRNADEFSAAEGSGGLRQSAGRRTGAPHRFQPDDQCHAAHARRSSSFSPRTTSASP